MKRGMQTWLRWTDISLRTLHIAVASALFGGILFQQGYTQLKPWHHLVIASGLALLAAQWLHDKKWLHRGKGLMVFIHVLFALSIHFFPNSKIPILWAIVISGSVGSHMPRRYRHWSCTDGWEKRYDQF